MSNRIEIDFTRSEGAVLRLIGLVERKGFDVCSVDMPETGPGPARLTLGVAPREASRRMDVLGRHVAKMYGVTAVRSEATREPCLERAS